MPRYAQLPEAVLLSNLSTRAKLTYAALQWHSPNIQPSIQGLAKLTSMGYRSVTRSLRELEKKGFVQVKRQRRERSKYLLDERGLGSFRSATLAVLGKASKQAKKTGKEVLERPHWPTNHKSYLIHKAFRQDKAKTSKRIEDYYRTLEKPNLPEKARGEIKTAILKLERQFGWA